MGERAPTLDAAIARIPALASIARNALSIMPLSSLSNRAYRIDTGDARYCLRIATSDGCGRDREHERSAAVIAADAGIGPPVVFCAPAEGLLLTAFLDHHPMGTERFATDPGAIERAAEVLRRLHRSEAGFTARIDPLTTLRGDLEQLRRLAAPAPATLRAAVREAAAIGDALALAATVPVPCHGDPVAANLLDDGCRMWLVDWEFAALGDAAWDLAELSLDAGFDATAEHALLAAYGDGRAPAGLGARVAVHKPLCDLVAASWALVQQITGNPATDFAGYAAPRLSRARTTLASPVFGDALRAIARRPPERGR